MGVWFKFSIRDYKVWDPEASPPKIDDQNEGRPALRGISPSALY